jgi:integrase
VPIASCFFYLDRYFTKSLPNGVVIVGRNVAKLVDAPTVSKFKVEANEPSEAKAFLQAIAGDRLEAIFAVAIALVLRRGEALGLQWSDIDFESRILKVNQSLQRLQKKLVLQELKTKSSRRVIVLPQILIKKLRDHHTRQLKDKLIASSNWQNDNLVFCTAFGTPIDPRNVKRKLDSILKNAKIRHYRIHDLRHFCAALLLAQGAELKVISDQLGHSSIRVTGDVYAHVLSSL